MIALVVFPNTIAAIIFWLDGPSWIAWMLLGFAIAELHTIIVLRYAKRTKLITVKKGPGWK